MNFEDKVKKYERHSKICLSQVFSVRNIEDSIIEARALNRITRTVVKEYYEQDKRIEEAHDKYSKSCSSAEAWRGFMIHTYNQFLSIHDEVAMRWIQEICGIDVGKVWQMKLGKSLADFIHIKRHEICIPELKD